MRSVFAAAVLLIVLAIPAHAEVNLSGQALYDLTDRTETVEQGRNNTGFSIRSSPPGATIQGGRVIGRGINLTRPWDTTHAAGNGGCIRVEASPGVTIRHHYGEFCWDGLKPVSGSRDFTIEDSWLRGIRDDAVEDDAGNNGIIRRTFLDGVHTFLSVTPGGGAPISGRVRVELTDNVMSLGCGLENGECEDREKRMDEPPARPRGHGSAFKVRGCGEAIDILFANNTVMMGAELVNGEWKPVGINTEADLAFFQCMRVQEGSTGNSFYWLGPTPENCDGSAVGLRFERFQGACVPADFDLDPQVFSHASNSVAGWLARVEQWGSVVWLGEDPDPDPDPDPAPDPVPCDCSAEVAAAVAPLNARITKLETELAAEQDRRARLEKAIEAARDLLKEAL